MGVLRLPVNSLTVEQVPYHTRPTIVADAGRAASQVMQTIPYERLPENSGEVLAFLPIGPSLSRWN
jgi:hypothetical protein